MSEWISTSDRLPEHECAVLAVFNDFPVFAVYRDDEWHILMLGRELDFHLHGNYEPFHPAYWMEIPRPPKEPSHE